VSWILFGLSLVAAIATLNALWPIRRPWWLKLASFNAGFVANEMPLHCLAGHSVLVGVLAAAGALDEPAGRVGLAVSAAAAVGLVVLAAAHRRARTVVDEAVRPTLGGDAGFGTDWTRTTRWPFPTAWLVLPGLAWFRTPGVTRVAGVVYTTAAGRDLELDIYRPESRREHCPVLVEIHGGGWIAGDRRLEARPLMAHMAARGWVCVSVDYRIGRTTTWPDQMIDVNTALAWVRDHVAEHGGDPDFVAITGGSAGGHLAALAALAPDEPDYRPRTGRPAQIRACVPFYGPYDFDNRLGLHPASEMRIVERLVVKVPLADDADRYARAAPLARVHRDAPPFLVVQGTSDNLVFPAESRAFVERLRETSQSPVAYMEVPRAHHAFDAVPSVRTGHVITGVERFLTHVEAEQRIPQPSASISPIGPDRTDRTAPVSPSSVD
jgi:acetyl esterase/lipase